MAKDKKYAAPKSDKWSKPKITTTKSPGAKTPPPPKHKKGK